MFYLDEGMVINLICFQYIFSFTHCRFMHFGFPYWLFLTCSKNLENCLPKILKKNRKLTVILLFKQFFSLYMYSNQNINKKLRYF